MADHLIKATAEGVRIFAAVTTNLAEEARKRHACYPVAAAALGRTMTGALLLAANLKTTECVTLKIQGDGPLGMVVADANADGCVRGYVDHPQVDLPLNAQGKLAVGAAVGKGLISVTRFTGLKQPFTGSAELLTGEIAEDLTQYLMVSEQTPSSVGLGVLVEKDLRVSAAGGFFVQALPEAEDAVLARIEGNLQTMPPVSQLIQSGADARKLVEAVFEGLKIQFYDELPLAFQCHCSKERIESVLISLGEQELASMAQEGKAEVGCHFCAEKYLFSKEELETLLKSARSFSEA